MGASRAPLQTRLPRVSADAIARPRLNRMLETDTPLTVLRGASGSGKTTALVGWASTTTSRVVWLTVSPSSSTTAALARSVGRRLHAASAPPRQDGSPPTDWHAIADELRDADEPLVLVLDDAAILDRESVFDLCRAVAAAPLARVIVATNRPSAWDSTGLDLVIDTTVVAPDDLMLTRRRSDGRSTRTRRRLRPSNIRRTASPRSSAPQHSTPIALAAPRSPTSPTP